MDIRHAEWINGCNRRATLLYPLGDEAFERVPNARRVEASYHAVLYETRRRIYGPACRMHRIDWLEVATDKAIQTIRDCVESGMVLKDNWERRSVDDKIFWTVASSVESRTLKH